MKLIDKTLDECEINIKEKFKEIMVNSLNFIDSRKISSLDIYINLKISSIEYLEEVLAKDVILTNKVSLKKEFTCKLSEMINIIDDYNDMPLEFIMFINYGIYNGFLDKSNTLEKQELTKYKSKLQNKIIEKFFSDIIFNLSGNTLIKYISIMNVKYSLKEILLKKFSSIVNINFYNESYRNNSFKIKQIKIDKYNKIEYVKYINNKNIKNYLFLPVGKVEFSDFDGGKNKREIIINRKENFLSYIDMVQYLDNIEEFNNNEFNRLFLFQSILTMKDYKDYNGYYDKKINNTLIGVILKNKDYFDNNLLHMSHLKELYAIRDELERDIVRDKSKENFINLIKIEGNKDNDKCIEAGENVYKLITCSKELRGEEADLETKILALMMFKKLNFERKKATILAEEIISKKPFVTKEINDFIIEQYRSGIYTENSIDVLKFLRIVKSEESDLLFIGAKAERQDFDGIFVEVLKNCISTGCYEKELNNIISKFINFKIMEYEKDNNINIIGLMEILLYFYERNNKDINTLFLLVKNIGAERLSFKNYLKSKDVIRIIKYLSEKNSKNHYITKDELRIVIEMASEFKKIREVRTSTIKFLEEIYKLENKELKLYLKNFYSNVLKDFCRGSKYLSKEYISLVKEKINDNCANINRSDIDFLEELLYDNDKQAKNEKLDNSHLIDIVDILVKVYTSNNDNYKLVNVLNKLTDIDISNRKGKIISDVLRENKSKPVTINLILKAINLKNLGDYGFNTVKTLLDDLVKQSEFDSILEIMFYLNEVGNIHYRLDSKVMNFYLDKCNKIDYISYKFCIIPLVESKIIPLDRNEVKIKLFKREDFPLDLLEKSIENMDESDMPKDLKAKISTLYCNKKIISNKARLIAMEYYYNDDYKFLELAQKHYDEEYIDSKDYTKHIINLINKKMKDKFKDDKEYVENLMLNDLVNKEINSIYMSEIRKIKVNLDRSYEKKYDNIDTLIDEYIVISRIDNGLYETVTMENIFTGAIKKELIAKNKKLEKILKNYEANKGKCFSIGKYKYNIKSEEMSKILEKVLELLKFIKDINAENLTIKNFTFNNFEEDYNKIYIKNRALLIPLWNDKVEDRTRSTVEKLMYETLKDFKGLILNIISFIDEENLTNRQIKEKKQLEDNISLEIDDFQQLERILKKSIKNSSISFKDMPLNEKIENVPYLNKDELLSVIDEIINKKSTSLKAREVIFNNLDSVKLTKNSMEFFIDYFNNVVDLTYEQHKSIYIKIIQGIKKNVIGIPIYDLENIFINATKNRKIKFKIIRQDVLNIVQEDKEYLLDKLDKIRKN